MAAFSILERTSNLDIGLAHPGTEIPRDWDGKDLGLGECPSLRPLGKPHRCHENFIVSGSGRDYVIAFFRRKCFHETNLRRSGNRISRLAPRKGRPANRLPVCKSRLCHPSRLMTIGEYAVVPISDSAARPRLQGILA